MTSYPGAGPEEIELQVTRYIEDAVSGLSDIDFITSISTEGSSSVTVHLHRPRQQRPDRHRRSSARSTARSAACRPTPSARP